MTLLKFLFIIFAFLIKISSTAIAMEELHKDPEITRISQKLKSFLKLNYKFSNDDSVFVALAVSDFIKIRPNRADFFSFIEGKLVTDLNHPNNSKFNKKNQDHLQRTLELLSQYQFDLLKPAAEKIFNDIIVNPNIKYDVSEFGNELRKFICDLIGLRTAVRNIVQLKAGTCKEFAYLSAAIGHILMPNKSVEIVKLDDGIGGIHFFTILNMKEGRDLLNPDSWGDKALVIDLWAKQDDEPGVYHAPSLPKYITHKKWQKWDSNFLFSHFKNKDKNLNNHLWPFIAPYWKEFLNEISDLVITALD